MPPEDRRAAARAYVAAVYPAMSSSHFERPGGRAAAVALLRSLHWYYAGVLASFNGSLTVDAAWVGKVVPSATLVLPPAFQCGGGRDSRVHTELLQRYTATPADFPFLPCKPGADCVRRQALLSPLPPATGRRFFEVWHFAFKSKREPARVDWPNLLDATAGSGAPAWWFWHAPGSGIFYDAGRTLATGTKLLALRQLLTHWSNQPVRERPPALAARVARLARRMGVGSDAEMLGVVNRTAHAELTCSGARLEACMHSWFLMDRWDTLLSELGRYAGYDSLYFTASTWGPNQALPYGELADLRPPPAEVGAAMRVLEGRLSLRDPLQPDGPSSRPCTFTTARPSLRLGCDGHVSARLRHVPRLERNCRRVDAAAGPHDANFMR